MSAVPNLPESVTEANGVAPLVNGGTNGHHVNGDISREANEAIRQHDGGAVGQDKFRLQEHPAENMAPVRAIVIGAGYSGIYMGIRLPERIRNLDLTIYEKNDGFGGTWYENRYPGCACDIPSHSYQYSFEPNKNWSALYAPAREIHAYLDGVAKKYSVDRFTKLQHEILDCRWDEGECKWHVKVRNLTTGEEFEDTSDILVSARGNLNNIKWPDIPGLRSFEGEIMHSAKWNQDYDFKNKRIAVIGTGSSAIQIVPSLQKIEGTTLNCFIRSQTWISPPFGAEGMQKALGMTDFKFNEEQIKRFHEDPEYFRNFRMLVEEDGNSNHDFTIVGTPTQIAAQQAFHDNMKERLAKKPEIFEKLKPNFKPGCRRLTPGPGYLEALVEDNVNFISEKITGIESKGVRTADGNLHEIDVLVCATGFWSSAPPPFTVTGLNGRTIQKKWEQRATTYMSLAVDDIPNHFMMLGPNAAIGTGSLTMMIENVGDYITKCVRKIQKENIRSMVVKPNRVRDFTRYVDAYFKTTVFTDECKSWYRTGDKITGLWPGSTLHCIEALRSPRWEDYEYEYVDVDGEGQEDLNQLGWLGNGTTVHQKDLKHLAWYLRPEFQEIPVAPKPEENEKYRIRPWSY